MTRVTGALLGAMVGANLLFPLVNRSPRVEVAYYFIYALILGSGVWFLAMRGWQKWAGVVLAVLAFLAGVADVVWLPGQSAFSGALVLLQGLLIVVLFGWIFEAESVTREVLLAGITIYLLLGAFFVPLYTQLEVRWPGSFNFNNVLLREVPEWPDFLYFSYATLTTLGYGDITPRTDGAKALAASEAVAGVLFIAVFMSRLVGRYAGDQLAKADTNEDP